MRGQESPNSRDNSHPTITELEEGRETNEAINTKTSGGIAGIHDNKNKKQNHEWFMLQAKLLLVFTVVAGVFVFP